jgi:hypothetical protein
MILTTSTTVDTSDATVMAGYSLAAFNTSSRPVIQNLGPGTLYIGTSATDITTKGIKVVTDAVYELPATLVEGAGKIFISASGGNCDVRILNVG